MHKKKNELGLLIEKLQKVPYGIPKHTKILSEIQSINAKRFKNEYVLCTNNVFNTILTKDLSIMQTLAAIQGIEDGLNEPIMELFKLNSMSVFENTSLFYVPRELAEFNLQYKQICVIGYITDGERIGLLRNHDDKGEISCIGGHVEFNKNDYKSVVNETFYSNMIQKLNISIKNTETLNIDKLPEFFINTSDSLNELCHMAFVYPIQVSSEDIREIILKTNEPKKYSIEYFNNPSTALESNDLSNWSIELMKHLATK